MGLRLTVFVRSEGGIGKKISWEERDFEDVWILRGVWVT